MPLLGYTEIKVKPIVKSLLLVYNSKKYYNAEIL